MPEQRDRWEERAPTKAAGLIRLMSDGCWHASPELVTVGGMRFGARLLEMRQGEYGAAVAIEKRVRDGERGVWEYRMVPARPPVTITVEADGQTRFA